MSWGWRGGLCAGTKPRRPVDSRAWRSQGLGVRPYQWKQRERDTTFSPTVGKREKHTLEAGMAKMRRTWHALLFTALATFHLNTAGADQCPGGSNIFTELPENSPNGSFVANLTGFGDPQTTGGLQLCLSGPDAHWLYLEGKTIRLNVSREKALDREALNPPVLVVALFCSEDDLPTVEYRVMIQVLNENDHRPHFQGEPLITQNISELLPLHSVVFATQAQDGDGDSLIYSIDNTSPDAMHFQIDLPNSGRVILAQLLDFEAKRQLEVVIYAMEMSTREQYKCSITIHINVLDGDDQYPSFLPCRPLGPQDSHVCISPIYTANVTEGETWEGPLHFQPGAIYAEDGDHDLKAAVSYSILTGADGDRFHMDNTTGALTMQKEAPSSQLTSAFHLTVMAAQVNDPRKYAVSEVLVRILAANHYPPRFSLPHHTAFVSEGPDTAALLVTYGGQVLSLHAVDPDFPNVIAQDEESGEVANTTVVVEVLPLGQSVPPDPSGVFSPPSVANWVVIVVSLILAVLLLGTGFGLSTWALRRWQWHQGSSKQTALAEEKHPKVLLVSQRLQDQVKDGKLGPSPGSFYFQNKGSNEPEALTGKGHRGKRAQDTEAMGPLLPTSRNKEPGSRVRTDIMSPLHNGRIPEPSMALGAEGPEEPSQTATENTGPMTGSEVMPHQGERTGEVHPEKSAGETEMGENRGLQGPIEEPRDVASSQDEIKFP
uniref:Cadherin domain-containing protein n=1 Tax=Monodelphis domestica TaxID=13616 RepID=A0A5F8GN58_MONDO